MPVIYNSTYKASLFFRSGNLQSIYPSLFRKIDIGFYRRERIELEDSDFLDLDWSEIGSNRLAIISHGLEGNTRRAYIAAMAQAFNHAGWDSLAWNYRSCSGEPNRLLRFYHNGATDDLHRVAIHALKMKSYECVVLLGFSMGGNLTLLYLGRENDLVPEQIKSAVTFSVPCDLTSSSCQLAELTNKIYMKRFLRMLHKKIQAKMEIFPDQIDDNDYKSIKDFKDFDDRYTAPIHGFKNAEDYWKRCSCKPYLNDIRVPSLIVNAKDDPFLASECYPIEEAKSNKNIFLEMPKSGGHVGFISKNKEGSYWSEKRAVEFVDQYC